MFLRTHNCVNKSNMDFFSKPPNIQKSSQSVLLTPFSLTLSNVFVLSIKRKSMRSPFVKYFDPKCKHWLNSTPQTIKISFSCIYECRKKLCIIKIATMQKELIVTYCHDYY